MASDSSDSEYHKTSVYKLRGRKNFHSWKQKTLSMASSKGYERFLLENVKVEDEDDIELKKEDYIDKDDADKRRKLKSEWSKMARDRRNSLKSVMMLTCSVRDKDLRCFQSVRTILKGCLTLSARSMGTRRTQI